ncbi:N-acetyltransferase GCN5 [Anaeromyces robustus]|uniref:N-acetyltransferase GCN5 n=1 Tax=Anaeromyces robustus TaxID=1754192 RepID=A0A1Y1WAQ2_9FUNG|nr:N-acetyltransferase GCN5 [Anaeromyces robustus]|eukprot:ORX70398.1 N-acetyltransferase GCN5 [Anaeromyces robustus]
MEFKELFINEEEKIKEMSAMASSIVKEHFDPIIGSAQNDYMIKKFQTVESIKDQLEHGYRYFFVKKNSENIGFLAFYPKSEVMYMSKFYLYKDQRGKGYSHKMLDFIIEETKKLGLKSIELNVNRNNSACFAYEKLGFKVARTEKNDIGSGFFMDDYVYKYDIEY